MSMDTNESGEKPIQHYNPALLRSQIQGLIQHFDFILSHVDLTLMLHGGLADGILRTSVGLESLSRALDQMEGCGGRAD